MPDLAFPEVLDFPHIYIDLPPARRVDFPPYVPITPWPAQTLYPTENAYVLQSDPNTPYDAMLNILVVGRHPDVFVSYSLLKFNVAGLPATGSGYQLKLWAVGRGGAGNITLYSVTDDSWSQNIVTWNNQPAHVDSLDVKALVAVSTWITFSSVALDNFIKAQITGDGIASLKLIGPVAGINYNVFNSKEAAPGTRPRLYLPAGP